MRKKNIADVIADVFYYIKNIGDVIGDAKKHRRAGLCVFVHAFGTLILHAQQLWENICMHCAI